MALFGAQGIGGRYSVEAGSGSITSLDVLVLAFDCRRARGAGPSDLNKSIIPYLWLDAFVAWCFLES